MFFVSYRTYRATAGLTTQLEYCCAMCGTRATANIETQGSGQSVNLYGIGNGAMSAEQGAQAAARGNAIAALQSAPCPRCGSYQPTILQRFAHYANDIAKKKARALPIAAVVAGLVFLAGVVPAIRDLKYSSALLVTMVFTGLTVFSLVYAIARWPGQRPMVPMANLHFWWGRHDGSVGWTPPPHVPLPAIPMPGSTHALGLAGMVLFGFVSLIALIVYGTTFENVYVVDLKDRAVVIDGVEVTPEPGDFHDKHVQRYSVRSGKQQHKVETAGQTFLLPTNASYGWVVAPEAPKDDVCFLEEETVYGGSSNVKPGYGILEPKGGILVLNRSYDDTWKESPKTQEVKQGSTVHRWSIRAVSCQGLEEDGLKRPDSSPGSDD